MSMTAANGSGTGWPDIKNMDKQKDSFSNMPVI